MTSKKKSLTTPSTSQRVLKIGSRVRCTDDGVEGRIVWANAVSLKIRWDDGEQVTWRRDSLADRPIEILDGGEDHSISVEESITPEQSEEIESAPVVTEAAPTTPVVDQWPSQPDPSVMETTCEPAEMGITSTEQHSESFIEPTTVSLAVASEASPAADTPVEETTLPEPTQVEQGPSEPMKQQPKATSTTPKQPRQRDSQQAAEDGKEKKLSALDAAAKVLAETGQAMTCQELIAAMAAKGYWTSPGGKTPQATLYSAMLREITTKGANSRFQKTDRGKFSRNDAV